MSEALDEVAILCAKTEPEFPDVCFVMPVLFRQFAIELTVKLIEEGRPNYALQDFLEIGVENFLYCEKWVVCAAFEGDIRFLRNGTLEEKKRWKGDTPNVIECAP